MSKISCNCTDRQGKPKQLYPLKKQADLPQGSSLNYKQHLPPHRRTHKNSISDSLSNDLISQLKTFFTRQ